MGEFRKNPSLGNGLSVVLDGLALAVPFVPGGVGLASKAAKATKAADKVNDAKKTNDGMLIMNLQLFGNKTGPKTGGRGPHNKKIREMGDKVTDGIIVAGGGRKKEIGIKTDGGKKSMRRPDILVERSDGSRYGINVGKTKKDGSAIKREAEAINDLEDAGIEMHYVPYDR